MQGLCLHRWNRKEIYRQIRRAQRLCKPEKRPSSGQPFQSERPLYCRHDTHSHWRSFTQRRQNSEREERIPLDFQIWQCGVRSKQKELISQCQLQHLKKTLNHCAFVTHSAVQCSTIFLLFFLYLLKMMMPFTVDKITLLMRDPVGQKYIQSWIRYEVCWHRVP